MGRNYGWKLCDYVYGGGVAVAVSTIASDNGKPNQTPKTRGGWQMLGRTNLLTATMASAIFMLCKHLLRKYVTE